VPRIIAKLRPNFQFFARVFSEKPSERRQATAKAPVVEQLLHSKTQRVFSWETSGQLRCEPDATAAQEDRKAHRPLQD
jgi:hypothetical protein